MGYSIDPISANCYPGTSVLINKFDIRDEAKLNSVESVLTAARTAQWLNAPLSDSFDFLHYKAIHRFLFADLYDWAGEVRTVNISKQGTVFCPAEGIEAQAERIFARLKKERFFQNFPHEVFVDEIVDFYCVTNELHPFREGNGRSMRIWLDCILKKELGKVIDWSLIDKEDYLLAMERSPIRDVEIKVLLKSALTDRVDDREVYMKGIDASYHYEGYNVYRTETVRSEIRR